MRSWPKKFVRACATSSLLAACLGGTVTRAAAQTAPKPAIALVDAADLAQWQTWTKDSGWLVIAPEAAPGANIDADVQAVESAVAAAIRNGSADPSRIYLAGRGDAASAVFYAVSRVADLFAAAVAIGGSPQPAIDTGRFFTANFSNVPILWAAKASGEPPLVGRLKETGLDIEWRTELSTTALLAWLASHVRAASPTAIDCETNSPSFASCYWIRLTTFDMAERNDVLPSSRVIPKLLAALDLGGFGYRTDDAGPGVLVSYLPEKYNGKLKMGDRIVAIAGREVANARQYTEMMAQAKEDASVAVMVERNKQRIRIETAIRLPRQQPVATARVQAKFDAEIHEVQIVSRAVTEMRVSVPAAFVPAVLNWNGVPVDKLDAAGCRVLSIDKELESAKPCP